MSTIDDLRAKALAIAENPGPWAWGDLSAVDPGTILALIEAAGAGDGAKPPSTSDILERAIVAAVEAQDASAALALAQAMDILDDIEARRGRRPS